MTGTLKFFLSIALTLSFAVACGGYQQSSSTPAASTSGSGTGSGSGSGSGTYTGATAQVSLVNESSAPVYQVFMSSSQQTSWGDELLNGRVLQPNQSFDLTGLAPGVWDIRVVDRDGLWKEFYNQQVNPNGNHRLVITSEEWNQSFR